ncbi:MAG: 50S ribosomal protein L25/general stress protein Ctc [Pseudomonadota bacterium]
MSLQHNKLIRALEDESFYSSILNIQVGDKNQETILKDLQRHPARHEILHVDLQRIVAGEAIRTNVPLHFTGEEICPGVKQHGGVISRLMNDVEVSCLPKDLPEYLEVDVSELDIDGTVHMSDIKLPKGVELLELAQGEGHDQPLLSISKPRAAVEEDDDTAAPEAPDAPPTAADEAAGDED